MKTTWLGSRQTREAREVAQRADGDEREHRRDCITCVRAVRQRRTDERCDAGRQLAKAKRGADAELAKQRRLDKLPIDGQEPLFAEDEVKVPTARQELTP